MGMDRIARRLQDTEPPLRVAELADMLNCSPRYIRKLIESEALPAGRVGSDYRIHVSEAAKLARRAGILRD
jgi:excisionase family DNA binding protein